MIPIQGVDGLSATAPEKPAGITRTEQDFSKMLTDMIDEVNTLQQKGDQAVQAVQAGDSKNLHEAMIALEQADISTRFLVQVRNKVLDAYQEIMRMQV